MSWQNIEELFEVSDESEAYNTLCASATTADFYFCVLGGISILHKRCSFIQIVPRVFFDEHERVPACPVFVDHLVVGALQELLGYSVQGHQNNLYVFDRATKITHDMMKAAGFRPSNKLLELVSEEVFFEG